MGTRVHIEQVQCAVNGPVTVGRVQLSHYGQHASGLASARTTDQTWRQVMAEATLGAMRVFVNGRLELSLDAVAEVRSGPHPLVVVTMLVGRGKNEVYTSGAAPMVGDRFTAVVKAVLHGLNRWVEPYLAAMANGDAGPAGAPKFAVGSEPH